MDDKGGKIEVLDGDQVTKSISVFRGKNEPVEEKRDSSSVD